MDCKTSKPKRGQSQRGEFKNDFFEHSYDIILSSLIFKIAIEFEKDPPSSETVREMELLWEKIEKK
jgi:hypothetical protein